MAAEWAGLVVRFCLATAAGDSLRTVYHDRIDGLLMPDLWPTRVKTRVSRELLNTLPPALVEALAPATQLIEAHSALN